MRPLIEACVEGIDGALTAQRAGADRIELCAALSEGGITPSLATIRAAVTSLTVPVHVIIRPRGGDFLYSEAEFVTMLADVMLLRAEGVAAVVAGCLTADGGIDEARMKALVDAAGAMSVTCHRAFDMTRDPFSALETLISCGVKRVLTSGQQPRAMDGVPLFQALLKAAAGRITLMGCGDLNAGNIRSFWQATGLDELHFAALTPVPSPMRYRNILVGMGAGSEAREYTLTITDEAAMRNTIAALR